MKLPAHVGPFDKCSWFASQPRACGTARASRQAGFSFRGQRRKETDRRHQRRHRRAKARHGGKKRCRVHKGMRPSRFSARFDRGREGLHPEGSPADKLDEFAGVRVLVSGTVQGETIRVESVVVEASGPGHPKP